MQKPQTSGWPRMLGEGAAIVVSILLAFAIDAWWEDRALRIEEQQVLRGLREEFVLIRDVLSSHLSEHRQNLLSLEQFLAAGEGGAPDEAGAIVDAAMLELLSPMTSDIGSGTLRALLSSGRIEILSSTTLRAQLAAWDGVIGEVWDDQALNAKAVFEIQIPYFLAANIPAGAAMHRWHDEWPLPRTSLSDDPELVSRILGDSTLRNLVAMRYGYKRHTTDEFEIAIAAVDAILAEIEASIH